MHKPRVLDQDGQERDWDWLVAAFGPVSVEHPLSSGPGAQVYRLTELRDVAGPAALVVRVLDAEGRPLKDVQVVRHFPDAPVLPTWPAPTSRWRERGVYGSTGSTGVVGFGLGAGDAYSLPGPGLSAVWVADAAGPSDLVSGLGMLASANHRHLDLVFQLQREMEPARVQAPPEAEIPKPAVPEPLPEASRTLTEEQWRLLIERLDQIIELLEERVQALTRSR